MIEAELMPPSAGSWDGKGTYGEIKNILHVTEKKKSFSSPWLCISQAAQNIQYISLCRHMREVQSILQNSYKISL